MNELSIDTIVDWLATSGVRILLVVLAIQLFRRFGMVFIRRLVRTSIKPDNFATKQDERQREDTLISIVEATFRILLWVVGGMIILDELGINIGPLVAGAGVIGLAIGFGAQSMVADFVSGLFIIMENQYRVGDVVELDGHTGTVEAITMRTTVLRDFEGNQHHIPNGSNNHSINKSKDFAFVNMNMGVGYESDMKKVEKLVNDAGKTLLKKEGVGEHIVEPPHYVRINDFADSAIEVKIMGKVKPGYQWHVTGEMRAELKKLFDKNNIEIPFPQRVVHNKK